MPFGGYKNFADCIRKNSDKKNPNAYCGSIMHAIEGKDFKMEEDTKLGNYGQTDYENQKISINPRAGDVVNTIIHEKLHADNPDMPHEEVYRKAYEMESEMSVRDMADMLNETAKDIDRGRNKVFVHYSKVVKQDIKK